MARCRHACGCLGAAGNSDSNSVETRKYNKWDPNKKRAAAGMAAIGVGREGGWRRGHWMNLSWLRYVPQP